MDFLTHEYGILVVMDVKAMTKVFPVLSLIGTTHAYLEKTSMMQSKYLCLSPSITTFFVFGIYVLV